MTSIWYLRSMGDRDTHRGAYSIVTRSVHALCGAEFEPLRQIDGVPIVLRGGRLIPTRSVCSAAVSRWRPGEPR